MTVHPALRALGVSAVFLLAACGGDTDPEVVSTSTTAAATSTTLPASAGCAKAPDVATLSTETPGDVAATFVAGDVVRAYRLAVPPSYDPDQPSPLIMNLHGSGSNSLQASVYGDVPRSAAERGMLVVTPEALEGRWELGGTGADADFLIALLDDVAERYCVDPDRVHLMGMSLGAWKAAATACSFPGRFASLALVTVEVFPGSCEPMPVIAFHGTADPTVAYGPGGGTVDDADTRNAGLPGALTNIAAWAESGGCDPEPADTTVGDDVRVRRFGGCDDGVGVELFTVVGGGHRWPGADVDLGDPSLTTETIDATELSLDWFDAHPAR
jgi:polyhydroxybutyrate depolymerase